MDDSQVTIHCMVRNELFWFEPVLLAILACTRNIIILDTGSEDGTRDLIEKLWKPGIRIEYSDHVLTPEENGKARQFMSDMTSTEWVFLVDGDELYDTEELKVILANPPPAPYELGFTTLINVDWLSGRFIARNSHNSQRYFRPKKNRWKGNYPFEVPHLYDDPSTYYYYHSKNKHGLSPHGCHLHCLKRSPLDDSMPIRLLQRKANSQGPISHDPYDLPWPPDYLFPEDHPYIPGNTLISRVSEYANY